MASSIPVTQQPVDAIMTRRVSVISPTATIRDAVNRMMEQKLDLLPVVDAENRCVGMLSRTDLTRHFMGRDNQLSGILDVQGLSLDWLWELLETDNRKQVQEWMHPDVATVHVGSTLTATCRMMTLHQVHHLPVVDQRESVVGIVSAFDVVNAIAEAEPTPDTDAAGPS